MRLSILTPSYNYGRFLDDAAQSILGQGIPAQWVIQDATSTDSTQDVVRRVNSVGITVDFKSEPDAGQSDALNRALLRANGDWIGWLNADEFYLPNAFEEVAMAIVQNPDADIIFGDAVFVDEESRYLRRLSSHRPSPAVLRWHSNYLSSCAVFVRSEVLGEIGWDTGFHRAMDWDLWLGLTTAGANFHYIPTTLAAFRIHAAQVTNIPESFDSEEFERLRAKHGLPVLKVPYWRRAVGRAVHAGLKLAGGAYVRELRGRHRHSSQDMRWWPIIENRHGGGLS